MKEYCAAAYMRLSVAGSKETESESIENQESIINYFVGNHPDIKLVSRRVDDGYSGIIFDRPGFAELMEDFKGGKIDCIIVKDLSRFGRDFIETGRYLCRTLPAYGIRFIAILDQIDTDRTPAKDDFVLHIKAAINDEFSRDISVRTRDALRTMRINGLYVGACPIYGYQKSREVRNKLVIDDDAAEVVQEIFRRKIEGYSVARIADILNIADILSPLAYKKSLKRPHPHDGFADSENPKWSPTIVFRILKDETYTGTLIQGKRYTPNYKIKKQFIRPEDEWIRVESTHEPIVSKTDFDTVQRLLRLDTRVSPGNEKVNLFSGLLICGSCGRNMTRKTNICNGNVYTYYYCQAGKKHCFSPVMIREDRLREQVFGEISNHVDGLIRFKERLLTQADENIVNQMLTQDQFIRIEKLQQEMGQAIFLKSSLYPSLVKGIISAEDYAEMTVAYNDEIIDMEKEIEILNLEMRSVIAHKQEHLKWLVHICGQIQIVGIDRIGIVQLVKRILVRSKNDVEVQFLFGITQQ